jgi:phage tail sheath protein FI
VDTTTLTKTWSGVAGYKNKSATLVTTLADGTSAAVLDPTYLQTTDLSAADLGYVLGAPKHVELSQTQYNLLKEGNFSWVNAANEATAFSDQPATWGHAGLIITNKAQTTINDKFEGYYLGFADNFNFNPATDYDAINAFKTVNANTASTGAFVTVPESRRVFALSATTDDTQGEGSISEVMEGIPTFDLAPTLDSTGTSVDKFKDTLVMGLFKMRSSVFSSDVLKLDYILKESYVGSLDEYRKIQNPQGGSDLTFFLGDVEDNSPNIEIHVNPNISRLAGSWTSETSDEPTKFVRMLTEQATDVLGSLPQPAWADDVTGTSVGLNKYAGLFSTLTVNGALYPLGYHQPAYSGPKNVGAIPLKIRRVLTVVENVDAVDIDITTEAGLGTIFTTSRNHADLSAAQSFDDTYHLKLGEATALGDDDNTGLFQLHQNSQISQWSGATNPRAIVDDYRAVYNEFHTFAEFKRKDHVFIADPLRQIFVQGENHQVLDDKNKTFTQHVYWPLKHLYGAANNSFSMVYGNWGKVLDGASGKQIWVPMSGMLGATYANSDSTYAPWYAPAGFTRGRIAGINRLAVIPKQKNRDQLYRINVNPVTEFPNEGMVIFGQKTMFKMPSAFDRINVRRLFLYLERVVRKTMKFFLFEPNTFLTRSRVVDTLGPVFEDVKNNEGMYDYLIICDDRNNTPEVIDQNEMVVDIYIKPVRAAEFILVNFYATRTGQDFSELVS